MLDGANEDEPVLRTDEERLRRDAGDRERYATFERRLAARWRHVQHYADAKSGVIEQILSEPRAPAPMSAREPVATSQRLAPSRASTASCGRAAAVRPSRPVTASALQSAARTASSVASTVASNTPSSSGPVIADGAGAVEKARKISPLP